MMTDREALDLMHKMFLRADFTDIYGDMDDSTPYEEALEYLERRLEKRKTPKTLISKYRVLELLDIYKQLKDNPTEYVLNTLRKTIEEEEPIVPSINYFQGQIGEFHSKEELPKEDGLYVTKNSYGLGFTQFKDGKWERDIEEWAEFQLMGKWV